jgi:hypothetical protein
VEAHDEAKLLLAAARAGCGPVIVLVVGGAGVPAVGAARLGLLPLWAVALGAVALAAWTARRRVTGERDAKP